MIRVLAAHVPMAQGCDVQVACHLLDTDTAVDTTGWPIWDEFVGGTVGKVLLFRERRGEEGAHSGERLLLVRRGTPRGGDDLGSRWRFGRLGQSAVSVHARVAAR